MTLTASQIKNAFDNFITDYLKNYGAMPFTKQEIKQAIQDAEAWAETPSVKSDFNTNLTAGNFKTNATADQKRLVLIYALLSIIKA